MYFLIHGVPVVVVVVVVSFYFPAEASTVINTTLKRADNRVDGCGVRKAKLVLFAQYGAHNAQFDCSKL